MTSDLLLWNNDLARLRFVRSRDRVVQQANRSHNLSNLLHAIGRIRRIAIYLSITVIEKRVTVFGWVLINVLTKPTLKILLKIKRYSNTVEKRHSIVNVAHLLSAYNIITTLHTDDLVAFEDEAIDWLVEHVSTSVDGRQTSEALQQMLLNKCVLQITDMVLLEITIRDFVYDKFGNTKLVKRLFLL